MKKIWAALFVLVVLSFVISCSGGDDNIGGNCAYDDIEGTATITSVETASDNASNCVDAVEVTFTFTPDDDAEDAATDQIFTVGDGKNPNRDWVEEIGMTVGATLDVVRKEISTGTCSPVVYDFADIDESDYADSCF